MKIANFYHVIGALVGIVLCGLDPAEGFDVITPIADSPTSTVWRIDQPNVRQHETLYPTIRFAPGDIVSVEAAGCVQTGGHGKTWKRYVDPTGPNADHLYHGMIRIPGITSGLVRLINFPLRTPHSIPDPLPSGVNATDLYLRLGYEDDNYSDNSYNDHDDGTGDQCKGDKGKNAYLIISIGHHVTPPDPVTYVGIPPAQFRCKAGWAFPNFITTDISWSSFAQAFSLDWTDYLDPYTYLIYLGGKWTIGRGGNCVGMSLIATVAEDQWVVGGLEEYLDQRYPNQDIPPVTLDINVGQWKQWSSYFIGRWFSTYIESPATVATAIESDLTKADYNYGVVTFTNGILSEGHAVVPVGVRHEGQKTFIDVYDPNHPCTDPAKNDTPSIIIDNGTWSYDMGAGDGIWSGSFRLAYIPYVGDEGWSDLGTVKDLLSIVFGSNVAVEQVTDPQGRTLYVDGQPGVINTSANGLSRSVVHAPMFGSRPRHPGSLLNLNQAHPETLPMRSRLSKLDKMYGSEYAGAQILLAAGKDVSGLTFTLSGKKADQPIRTMVHRGQQSFEVRSLGPASTKSRHSLVVPNAKDLGGGGISVQPHDSKPFKITMSHSVVSPADGTVTLHNSNEVTVSEKTDARIESGEMKVRTAQGPLTQAKITTEVLNRDSLRPIRPRPGD